MDSVAVSKHVVPVRKTPHLVCTEAVELLITGPISLVLMTVTQIIEPDQGE